MKRLAITLITAALIFAVPYALGTYFHSEPSTAEINADLAEVEARLAAADEESEKYTGGAILALIEIRRQVLENTKDMLLQKKKSFLRRIDLTYQVDGVPKVPDADRMRNLEADLAEAHRKVEASEAEAARYSGGMIQAVALITAATEKLSVVQLEMSLLAEKYGMFVLFESSGDAAPAEPPNIVNDGEAL